MARLNIKQIYNAKREPICIWSGFTNPSANVPDHILSLYLFRIWVIRYLHLIEIQNLGSITSMWLVFGMLTLFLEYSWCFHFYMYIFHAGTLASCIPLRLCSNIQISWQNFFFLIRIHPNSVSISKPKDFQLENWILCQRGQLQILNMRIRT